MELRKSVLISLLIGAFVVFAQWGCGGSSTPATHGTDLSSDMDTLSEGVSPDGTEDVRHQGENHVPVAQQIGPIQCVEDQDCEVQLKGSDPDGDKLVFYISGQPMHGELDGLDSDTGKVLSPDGKVTYKPDKNYNGEDQFQFYVSDGTAQSDSVTVEIKIKPQDDPPVVQDMSESTDEDTPVDITLHATDPDSTPAKPDLLTYEIVDQPVHGTLDTNDMIVSSDTTQAKVTYTPDKDYNGDDSFTFKVKDAEGSESNVATVQIKIRPVNDPPVAKDQSNIATDEDTPVDITLDVSDVDHDPLTVTVPDSGEGAPQHGKVTVDSNNPTKVTYTPDKNWPDGHTNGTDSFTYRVCDNSNACAKAKVTITVNSENDAPVIQGQTVDTDEDTPKDVTLNAVDPDGDKVTYTVDTLPKHGKLYQPDGSGGFAEVQAGAKLNGNSIHYVPDPNWPMDKTLEYGEDSVAVKACDGYPNGEGLCTPFTVTVHVKPVNDPPTVKSFHIVAKKNQGIVIQLKASDADGDKLSFTITEASLHGELRMVDDKGDITDQKVKVGDTLKSNSVGFVPRQDYITPSGGEPDAFKYKASDGQADSNEATVTITVKETNHKPTVQNAQVSTQEDTAVEITLKGADSDGDKLTFRVTRHPNRGQLSDFVRVDDTTVKTTYTPNKDDHGSDSFKFVANDGTVDSDEGEVDITITAVDDAPVAKDVSTTTDEDTAKDISISATDVDNDASDLTFTLLTNKSQHGGTLTLNGTTVTYTPPRNWPEGHVFQADQDTDQFKFQVCDPDNKCDTGTVKVSVKPVEDAPSNVAVDPAKPEVNEDDCVNMTFTADDADGDTVKFYPNGEPQNGTFTVNEDGAAKYCPNPNWPPNHKEQPDNVTVDACDGYPSGRGHCTSLDVIVKVDPVNDLPVSRNLSVTVDEDSTADDAANAITLQATDADGDNITYSIVTLPSNGKLYYKASGGNLVQITDKTAFSSNTIYYVPNPNWPPGHDNNNDNGKNIFEYQACDNYDLNNPCGNVATGTVIVTPEEDAPSNVAVTPTNPEVNEDGCVNMTFTADDADGDPVKFYTDTDPQNGTLTVNEDGTAKYCPNPNWPPHHTRQSDNFTVDACDGYPSGKGKCTSLKVTAHVDPVNDQPVADAAHYYTPFETPDTVTLSGSDVDQDTLNFQIATQPKHGTARITTDRDGKPALQYTPDYEFHGMDTVMVRADDGQGENNSLSAPVPITFAVGVRFVNVNATGAGTGYTWTDAFTTIAGALNVAQANDQVWVAKGTYSATTHDPVALMKDGISIYGSFAGTESLLSQRPAFNKDTTDDQYSILDGNSASLHVVVAASNAVLNGFIIKKGKAQGSGDDAKGAGVFVPPGVESFHINGCRVENNLASFGAGLYVSGNSYVIARNIVFNKNHANSFGGSIFVNGAFIGVDYVTAYGDNAGSGGYFAAVKNRGMVEVSNSIIWVDNTRAIGTIGNGNEVDIADSDVQNACPTNANCDSIITGDPNFVDQDAGGTGLHLSANSPCIDAAKTQADFERKAIMDSDRQPRPFGIAPDMGAYEYQETADSGRVICVDSIGGLDSNTGFGWNKAKATIANALTTARLANPPITEIWVKEGGYAPFDAIDNVNIRGGFAGTEQYAGERTYDGTHVTLIDGTRNAYAVQISGKHNVQLDGLTFSNTDGENAQYAGAVKVYNNSAGIHITHCNFTNNFCPSNGADTIGCGLTVLNSGDVYVEDTNFTDDDGSIVVDGSEIKDLYNVRFSTTSKISYGKALAIYVNNNGKVEMGDRILITNTNTSLPLFDLNNNAYMELDDLRVLNNIADGGMIVVEDSGSQVVLDYAHVMGNQLQAPVIKAPCSVQVHSSVFESNDIRNAGTMEFGDGYSRNACTNGPVVITKSMFDHNNVEGGNGGCIRVLNGPVSVINSVLHHNTTTGYGGAFAVEGGSLKVYHNTVASNSAQLEGGALYINGGITKIYNTILWGNTSSMGSYPEIYKASGTLSVTYSDADTNLVGDGNIHADPKFVDFANHDYHLQADSPCIDKGNEWVDIRHRINYGHEIDTDYDDHARPRWLTVDMGAFEYQPENTATKKEILYVKSGGSDSNSGDSWAEAFGTLKAAIKAVTSDTKEIWVSAGTYTPPSGQGAYSVPVGVAIYGSLPVGATSLLQQPPFKPEAPGALRGTVFDGNGQVCQIFDVVGPCRIDGVGVTGGLANSSLCPGTNGYGAGLYAWVYNYHGPFYIVDDKFYNNRQQGYAGGGGDMYVFGSSAWVMNSLFSGSESEGSGGGILLNASSFHSSAMFIGNCVFTGESADNGGALNGSYFATLNMDHVLFSNCSAEFGGAIEGGSPGRWTNVWFKGNHSNNTGGAISYIAPPDTLSIENAVFWKNQASGDGGAIYYHKPSESNPNPINVTGASFAKNSANNGGAVAAAGNVIEINLYNCALGDDSCTGAGCYKEINGRDGTDYTVHAEYSVVHQVLTPYGFEAGTNLKTEDPQFYAPDSGKLNLQCSTSPAVDLGNGAKGLSTDINGKPRVDYKNGGGSGTTPYPDAGAYECQN